MSMIYLIKHNKKAPLITGAVDVASIVLISGVRYSPDACQVANLTSLYTSLYKKSPDNYGALNPASI